MELLTVHRMFRTQFLRGKAIRFRERVGLLEDHPFAVESYLKADVVSVLADYPVYRWIVQRGGSSGSQRLPDLAGHFANIRDSVDVVEGCTEPGHLRESSPPGGCT